MAHAYRAVGFNRQKVIYDGVLWLGIVAFLAVFVGWGQIRYPAMPVETLLVRSLAFCAFFLLHVILSIGPLTRLSPRFLPLLYNRRHLGVSMFLLALAHAAISTIQFHGFGVLNPVVSLLISDGSFSEPGLIPFQRFGLGALLILAVMAATSHDFWLAQFTAPTWKRIHMAVYVAYALLVAHVVFGYLQDTTSRVPFAVTVVGATWIVGLHAMAAIRERRRDGSPAPEAADGFVDVCAVQDIPDRRSVSIMIGGERVAVFRNGNEVSAVSAVCQHQNGPLDEGRIIDGFITCPWHGYQYCPRTGTSPPPYDEVIPTFDVRLEGERVLVQSRPNGPREASRIIELPT